MQDARALLDSLMGSTRNVSAKDNHTPRERYSDYHNCAQYIVGFCPYAAFYSEDTGKAANSSPCGTCPKTHTSLMKQQFDDLGAKAMKISPEERTNKQKDDVAERKKYTERYEKELLTTLRSWKRDIDRGIEDARHRMRVNGGSETKWRRQMGLAPMNSEQLLEKKIVDLKTEISKKLQLAQETGEKGDLVESNSLMKQAEGLNGELHKCYERGASLGLLVPHAKVDPIEVIKANMAKNGGTGVARVEGTEVDEAIKSDPYFGMTVDQMNRSLSVASEGDTFQEAVCGICGLTVDWRCAAEIAGRRKSLPHPHEMGTIHKGYLKIREKCFELEKKYYPDDMRESEKKMEKFDGAGPHIYNDVKLFDDPKDASSDTRPKETAAEPASHRESKSSNSDQNPTVTSEVNTSSYRESNSNRERKRSNSPKRRERSERREGRSEWEGTDRRYDRKYASDDRYGASRSYRGGEWGRNSDWGARDYGRGYR